MSQLYACHFFSLRQLLLRQELSPKDLVRACLLRMQATEPQLNCCLSINEEQAYAQAEELEKQGPDETKPLWGIPVVVKDNICTKTMPTTCASAMLAGFFSPYDAFVVQKIKQAGAILLAKTNMDEFAMGSSTEFSVAGPSSNPWNTSYVSGGSSGGSAASVSAKQVFAALGSDSGGSVRQAAALCGCVGLKPTYGRVSRYGLVAYAGSLEQIGPIARDVKSCALTYAAIAGHDERDAASAFLPDPSPCDWQELKDLSHVRIGLVRELWNEAIDSEVVEQCEAVLTTAKKLKAQLIELSLPSLRYASSVYSILSCAEASTNMARFDGVRFGFRDFSASSLRDLYAMSRSQGFGEEVKRRILFGTHVLSADLRQTYYDKATQLRRLIHNEYQKALENCTILLAPTSPTTAWEKGLLTQNPLAAYTAEILTLGTNLAGLPGLSMPAGLGRVTALPVGIHLIGKAFEENSLFQIATLLERYHPPLPDPHGLLN